MSFLVVVLAAACGAAARYLLDYYIVSRTDGAIPWGTFTVNVSGSFALGVLLGLVVFRGVPAEYEIVFGTGFLGAYTTFSTWLYEVVRLLEQGRVRAGLWNVLGSWAAGTAAAAVGLWIAWVA